MPLGKMVWFEILSKYITIDYNTGLIDSVDTDDKCTQKLYD